MTGLENLKNICLKVVEFLDNLRNYESIVNSLNYQYIKYFKNINNFVSKNYDEKLKLLINKIINENNKITMTYKIFSNKTSVKIFGAKFVENNMNNCFLILNDCKLMKLSEFIEIDT